MTFLHGAVRKTVVLSITELGEFFGCLKAGQIGRKKVSGTIKRNIRTKKASVRFTKYCCVQSRALLRLRRE